MFNGTSITQSEIQKHFLKFLDSKLDFKEHIQNVLNKVRRTIGLLRKLQKILPRPPLITIYKSFIRYHLGNRDIIYDQAYNVSFENRVHSVQHCTSNNRAVRGTFRQKLYYELGFELLVSRGWYHKLFCFYNVFKTQSTRYLFDIYLFLQPKEPILQEIMISCLISK